MILNYVTHEWRAREQLSYPDRPVRVWGRNGDTLSRYASAFRMLGANSYALARNSAAILLR